MASKMDIEKRERSQEDLSDNNSLPADYRDYLLTRHGTIDLDPLPTTSEADPLNWSSGKKDIMLSLVAFHAMMATFTASAVQCAFVNIAGDLHVSVQDASYLTSLFIAVLGIAPLFWRPLADRWGRRPVFLISLLGSMAGNIGCAKSPTYATMAVCRAITAFMISPAAAIGSGVVAELFFKKQRGRYMGVWTVMVTLGVPISPFIFGFLALRVSYRWIYWTLAITNAVQFALYLLVGSETLYNRAEDIPDAERGNPSLFRFRRIIHRPLRLIDFVRPLRYFAYPCIFFPAAAYAMEFSFASILITIEMPQLYPEKFGFNTQQVGLQFISVIIGSLIGEVIGGRLSDAWMGWRGRKLGRFPHPEFRLWLSYLAYPLAIVGVAVFLACFQIAGKHWTVAPDVGAAIAAVGNQIATTVLVTYAVDCYRHDAASVGVFITFVRQIWGFIGPFWFPTMIATTGLSGSAGISSALMIAVCFPATALLQWKGPSFHS